MVEEETKKVPPEMKSETVVNFVVGAYLIIFGLNLISFLFSNFGKGLSGFMYALSNFAALWAFPSIIIYFIWKGYSSGLYGMFAAISMSVLLLLFFPVLRVSSLGGLPGFGSIGNIGLARIPGLGISFNPLINLILSVAVLFGIFSLLRLLGRWAGGGVEGFPQVRDEIADALRGRRRELTPEERAREGAAPGGGFEAPRYKRTPFFRRLFRTHERSPRHVFTRLLGVDNPDILRVLRDLRNVVSERREQEIRYILAQNTGYIDRIRNILDNVVSPLITALFRTPPSVYPPGHPRAGQRIPLDLTIYRNVLERTLREMGIGLTAIRRTFERENSSFLRLLNVLQMFTNENIFLDLNRQRVPELMGARDQIISLIEDGRKKRINAEYLAKFYQDLGNIFLQLGGDPRFRRAGLAHHVYADQMWSITEAIRFHTGISVRLFQGLIELRRTVQPNLDLIREINRDYRVVQSNLAAMINEIANRMGRIQDVINRIGSLGTLMRNMADFVEDIPNQRRAAAAAGGPPVPVGPDYELTHHEATYLLNNVNIVRQLLGEMISSLNFLVDENDASLINLAKDPFSAVMLTAIRGTLAAGLRPAVGPSTIELDRRIKSFINRMDGALVERRRGVREIRPAELFRELDPLVNDVGGRITNMQRHEIVVLRDTYSSFENSLQDPPIRIREIIELRDHLGLLVQILNEELGTRDKTS